MQYKIAFNTYFVAFYCHFWYNLHVLESGGMGMNDAEKYFKKHNLSTEKILYLYRRDRKTVICFESGKEAASSIPMHEMLAFLPEEEFVSIAKGVVVRRDKILHIANDGVYTMTDGRTFQGRKRYLSAHKQLRKELDLSVPALETEFVPPLGFYEKCSILDDMPVAYCVIELVFDAEGHGIDFIFRYCNKQMEVVEGLSIEEMLNHSFYEVFKNGDRKWLVTYADVALNGVQRVLHDYSPEIDKDLTIYCYQPEHGFCACVLVPE